MARATAVQMLRVRVPFSVYYSLGISNDILYSYVFNVTRTAHLAKVVAWSEPKENDSKKDYIAEIRLNAN